MLRLTLPTSARSNLRFAYSPLLELTISYRLLRGNWNQATYWRWIEEARQSISDVEFPYMDQLITPGQSKNGASTPPQGYIPDFLTPTPTQPILDIEREFDDLLNLPHDVVREAVQFMIYLSEPTELLCDFLAHPHDGIRALIAELRDYWNRTLAHHWNRMVAVLENDILYHSRVLTLNGLETLFPTINDSLAYDAGTITMNYKPKDCLDEDPVSATHSKPDKILEIDSDQFNLVPVIFAAQGVYYQVAQPWQPMMLYTPRGAGLWNYETPEPLEALELVMGAGKSRILLALETPFSTGELARKLSLTSGAVSQQLGKLHQAGLVESHRSGKHVFYRLSQRGIQLVGLFC